MTKHKRFHGGDGKGKQQRAYAWFHTKNPSGSVRGLARNNALKALTIN